MRHDREKVRAALQRLLANGPGLVDAKFLTRNKAGSAYAATMGRVGEVVAGAAQDVVPAGILEEIRRDRASRKRDRVRQEAAS